MAYTDEQYEKYCETIADDIAYDSCTEDLSSAEYFFASIKMKIKKYEIMWNWGRSYIDVDFISDIPTYCLWVPDELPEGESDGLFIAEGCVERWRERKPELEALASVTEDILDKMDAVEYRSDEYNTLEDAAWTANNSLIAKWEEIAQDIANIVAAEIQAECEAMFEREHFEEWADVNEWFVEASMDKRAYDIQGIIDDVYDATRDISRVELYDYNMGQTMLKLVFEVDGDWKHDHLRFDNLVSDMLDKKGIDYTITNGEVLDDTGCDWYAGTHNIFITLDNDRFASKKTAYIDESTIRSFIEGARDNFNRDYELWFDDLGQQVESPYNPDIYGDGYIKDDANGVYICISANDMGYQGYISSGITVDRCDGKSQYSEEIDHFSYNSDSIDDIVSEIMNWLRNNRYASKKTAVIDNTFFMDFTIADAFGKYAIQDTFDRAFNEWKDDYEYLTALVIALNHKIWQHYEEGSDGYAKLYNDLWEKADAYACDNLKGEELAYFYRETD